jgi:hypothetical protein
MQAIQLVAAEGEHHQHPAGAEGGGEEGDQVAGGAVGPVKVLHDPQQRRARGQPLDHAEQQLEQPPLTRARDGGTRGRLAAPAEVGQQPGQLGARRTGDRLELGRVQLAGQAVQRLHHRRERQALPTQRHAAATQHPHPLLAGGGGQLLDQAGLADPRLSADQRHQGLAVGGAREQLAQPRQLLGAADEAPGRDLVRHDGPSMRAGAEEGRARI